MSAVILAQWTAHPARRRPQDIALVAMTVLVFCGAVLASLQSLWLTVLAALILIIAIAPFLFPTHYRLTEDGVYERRLGRERGRRWAELRRFQIGKGAVLVSPFAKPSALDRYRGLVLYLDGGNRDQIESILGERIDAACGARS